MALMLSFLATWGMERSLSSSPLASASVPWAASALMRSISTVVREELSCESLDSVICFRSSDESMFCSRW